MDFRKYVPGAVASLFRGWGLVFSQSKPESGCGKEKPITSAVN
jgi:hypothetical protein